MKTISILFAALCCAAPIGPSAAAGPSGPSADGTRPDAGVRLAGSSDGAGLPGAPGGRGGAPGRVDPYPSAKGYDVAALQRYCMGLLDPRKPTHGAAGYRPSDCAGYFASLGDPAADHPSSGWGGAGGGAAGRAGASDAAAAALQLYCIGLLTDPQRSASSSSFRPSDCADYFASLDGAPGKQGHKADGPDGPGIAGGVGGRGGKAGAGAGGGRGGGGGAGVSGTGGRGGAGGATD